MTFEFYSYRRTFFHDLSPPTKIIFLLTTSIVALVLSDPLSNGLMLAALVGLAAYVRIPRPVLSLFSRTAIVVGIVITISWLFFTHQGTPVLKIWGSFSINSVSVDLAITYLFRLWSLLASTMIFLVITRESEFISGLRKLKLPFSISLMLALVLRFIPMLYSETIQIREAQMARGLELEKIGLLDRMRKFVAILIPWLVISIKLVSSFTLAVSSRGYEVNTGIKRTFFREPHLASGDYFVIVVLIAATIIVTILRFAGYFMIAKGGL